MLNDFFILSSNMKDDALDCLDSDKDMRSELKVGYKYRIITE